MLNMYTVQYIGILSFQVMKQVRAYFETDFGQDCYC